MRKINIQITKAQIRSFEVTLDKKKPSISIQLDLFNDYGKKITSYQISTDHWEDENKFELPIRAITPIMKIMRQLEIVAIQHCNKEQKAIKEGK